MFAMGFLDFLVSSSWHQSNSLLISSGMYPRGAHLREDRQGAFENTQLGEYILLVWSFFGLQLISWYKEKGREEESDESYLHMKSSSKHKGRKNSSTQHVALAWILQMLNVE